MSLGSVQLVVLGFPEPDFHGEIVAEIARLAQSDTIRVIDALAVYKDPDGDILATHMSAISDDASSGSRPHGPEPLVTRVR